MSGWKELMVGDGSQFGGKGAAPKSGGAFGGGEKAPAKTVAEAISKDGAKGSGSPKSMGKFGNGKQEKDIQAKTVGQMKK